MDIPKIDPTYNKEQQQAKFKEGFATNCKQQVSTIFSSMQVERMVCHYHLAHPDALDDVLKHMKMYWDDMVSKNIEKAKEGMKESFSKGTRETSDCLEVVIECQREIVMDAIQEQYNFLKSQIQKFREQINEANPPQTTNSTPIEFKEEACSQGETHCTETCESKTGETAQTLPSEA